MHLTPFEKRLRALFESLLGRKLNPWNRHPLRRTPGCGSPPSDGPAHRTPRSAKRFPFLGNPSCGELGTSFREANVQFGAPDWRRAWGSQPNLALYVERLLRCHAHCSAAPQPRGQAQCARQRWEPFSVLGPAWLRCSLWEASVRVLRKRNWRHPSGLRTPAPWISRKPSNDHNGAQPRI